MFGNLQGWMISAVMLIASAGALIYLGQPATESTAHNSVPLAFKPIALPMSAETVQPAPTQDCDAAESYRKAIDLYLADPKLYQRAALVDAAQVPAVGLVVEGAGCSHMHLFDTNPTQAITYDKKPWIEAVSGLGEATTNAALRLKATHKPEEAEKYYSAAFELGRKLFNERVTWDEMNAGLTIMYTAAEQLATMADLRKDGARVDACNQFAEATKAYRTELQEKVASPLGNPVESYSAPFAGDVFAVAKDVSAERPWRVAAILHLGHYRFDVATQNRGDQVWAPRELQAIQASNNIANADVAIKTAVDAAQKLTADQHHMTGSTL